MARFTVLDYGLFVFYLIASVLVGVLFVKEQRTVKDYFLAGRSMGYLVVSISVIAALFSGITYLGAPAEVYAHDLSFFLVALSFFIATPLTTVLFLPFFYHARFYTAYQFLEERFSVGIRTLASILFIMRVLLWLALATYAPALALEQVTGLPLWFTISSTAILTTFYTTLGGMKAVIWTDVMQFAVLFGGQVIILAVALMGVPGGAVGAWEIGEAAGKIRLDWSFDPSVRITFWGLLIGGAFMNLVQMATDQVSVQRYLTATDLKEAQRSLWLKLWLTVPVLAVFYLSGLALFAFYQSHPDPLATGAIKKADQILPYFVITQLPVGLPGLLISAIYAASMSTISAGINALTTCTLVDVYQRHWKPDANEGRMLQLARWLTIGYGGVVLVLAFVVERLGSLLEVSNAAIGLVGGPLLGIFLLGMLDRRAHAKGAFLGWLAGLVVLIPVVLAKIEALGVGSPAWLRALLEQPLLASIAGVSFLWYAAIGCVATTVVGALTSRLLPGKAHPIRPEAEA